MRLLILGGTGMLGHTLWRHAHDRPGEAFVTLRGTAPRPSSLWQHPNVVAPVDVHDVDGVAQLLDEVRPTVVVNCIGITKSELSRVDVTTVHRINSAFPHALAALTEARDIRLIHVSTDCVFRGDRGHYHEADVPDADDLYGRSKADGEPSGFRVLTIRTSMIGRELRGYGGLLEWFLAQRHGHVQGFRRTIFSGLDTHTLADILLSLAQHHPHLNGLYHVAAEAIDKDALLRLLNDTFATGVSITGTDEPHLDRSLDGTAFRAATGLVCPDWPAMVAGLAADRHFYDTRGTPR